MQKNITITIKRFVFCFLCLILTGQIVEAKKHILYVGTYTEGMADGIFVYLFNDNSGKLVNLKIPVVSINPSFLAISPDKKYLYSVSEVDIPEKNHSGCVSSYLIERSGKLSLISQVMTNGPNPCHVSVSPDGKKLVTSNYSGGNLSFFNVLPDGSLSEMIQRIQHTGSGPFPGRQTEPHAHSAKFDPSGKFLFVADLGIDELKIYNSVAGDAPFTPASQPFVKLPPGSGPRHFDFSSDGNYIYLINELNSTITVLMRYGNVWKSIQTIKTLPKEFKGESWCADIHLSADGRFVYGSNRGHNSIAVFKRDKVSGKLEMIQTVSVEGNWPRNFALDPSGLFLLVANQKSNDITVFSIDEIGGTLKYTGIKVPNQSPVCLQFL
jgi:6-phosphogluconolactonase